MSAVTAQPLPFGCLEREKHIETLFRAFQGKRRCSTEVLPGSSAASCSLREAGLPRSRGVEDQSPRLGWEGEEEGRAGLRRGAGGVEMSMQGGNRCPGTAPTEGLALLDGASQLHITAKPELQGPHCVPRRTYSIATGNRDQLYVAVEESSCLCLQCCGPARSCSLRGFDRQARQVFLFERPLRADACCLGCCLMEMRAFNADRQLIGTVHQRWSVFTPLLEICDSDGTSTVRIQGSCCPCRFYSNQEFQVVSSIGESLGRIWKKWPGFNEECNMDHEYFGLDVTQEMSTKTKVLLLAATFLLNHMFFEMS
ncbi:phospholipid scramblase family member 5 [Megalops cyprinoides]|uniref:phospholipid scramblase family member 5 n=1 Tax=Megalops cyprinoides TaxID=118141 RepID=UPI0018656094|nr:phospholipid scramblase family member 5 [Megalops cyprinoides]